LAAAVAAAALRRRFMWRLDLDFGEVDLVRVAGMLAIEYARNAGVVIQRRGMIDESGRCDARVSVVRCKQLGEVADKGSLRHPGVFMAAAREV
jgi:hypothetical protein